MYYNNTSHFIFDIASLKVQALHHFLATDLLAHLEYYTLNDYINAMYESGKESGLLKPPRLHPQTTDSYRIRLKDSPALVLGVGDFGSRGPILV